MRRHRLRKRPNNPEVSRRERAEKRQENTERNNEMENHKEQRDTEAHRAGKKTENGPREAERTCKRKKAKI